VTTIRQKIRKAKQSKSKAKEVLDKSEGRSLFFAVLGTVIMNSHKQTRMNSSYTSTKERWIMC